MPNHFSDHCARARCVCVCVCEKSYKSSASADLQCPTGAGKYDLHTRPRLAGQIP